MSRMHKSIMAGGLALCGWVVSADAGEPALCPEPAAMTGLAGEFKLVRETAVVYAPQAAGAEAAARLLAEAWRLASGLSLAVLAAGPSSGSGAIRLVVPAAGKTMPAEGYGLRVSPEGVVVEASDAAGFFYGAQTLRQLAPAADFTRLPGFEIFDAPRFGWRGLMLDESRHFMGKAAVCRILDAMASLKLNRFHWHLTDAPGWRLEIKRFPELTTVGATGDQSNPARAPQFYTQAEIREVLAYARSRHILVVPEIELPAHATAAMRAYPNLSCTGRPEFMYCAGYDAAIRFLEQVLDETVALFDSPFIHIGGDECPKTVWQNCPKCQARKAANGLKDEHELQSWMIRHFDQYLAKQGRRLIGWDEILEGGLAPGAAVMSWRGLQGGQAAAALDHDVVMTPQSFLYLDYPQTAAPDRYSYYRVRVNSCERILGFNPVEGIPADKRQHVLGMQGNLWTETVNDPKEAEWKLFPRAAAIAEVAWSPAAKVSWTSFQQRVPAISARLTAMGLNVAPTAEPAWYLPVAAWKAGELTEAWGPREWDVSRSFGEPGTYKARFIFTGGKHRLLIRNATLLENGVAVATDPRPGTAGANHSIFDYSLVVPAAVKPAAVYTLRAEVRGDGGNDSNGTICVFPARLDP